MNESSIAMQATPETVLNSKITLLMKQHDSFESLDKDVWSIISRLTQLGMRVNSFNHPENAPKEMQGGNEKVCKEAISDGVIGRLDSLIDRNQDLINRFNNSTWSALLRNIEYIEQHI